MPGEDEKKMIPEADLMAYKTKAGKLLEAEKGKTKTVEDNLLSSQAEVKTLKANLAEKESELKLANVDVEDNEAVSEVKRFLTEKDADLTKRELALEEKTSQKNTEINKREREVVATELGVKYKVTPEDLEGCETVAEMTTKAAELFADKVAKGEIKPEPEGDKTGGEGGKEPVLESTLTGVAKTGVWEEKQEDFDKRWEEEKEKAAAQPPR